MLLFFVVECVEDRIDFLRPFEGGDQFALFIISGEIRQVADPVKGWEGEFFVPAHEDIGMIENAVMRIEVLQFIKRLVGGHDDLDILKILEVGEDGLGLVLAMLAIRAEEHDDRLTIFFDIVFTEIRGAVELKEVEGRNGRETHIGSVGVGRIGGGLIG